MVAVYTSFILNGDPIVKEFGLGLAAAIAVDATIVRCLLVPGGDGAARDARTGGCPRWALAHAAGRDRGRGVLQGARRGGGRSRHRGRPARAPSSLELHHDRRGDQLGERPGREAGDRAAARVDHHPAAVALELHVEVDRDWTSWPSDLAAAGSSAAGRPAARAVRRRTRRGRPGSSVPAQTRWYVGLGAAPRELEAARSGTARRGNASRLTSTWSKPSRFVEDVAALALRGRG